MSVALALHQNEYDPNLDKTKMAQIVARNTELNGFKRDKKTVIKALDRLKRHDKFFKQLTSTAKPRK